MIPISIFVASSYEMAEWRETLGDAVRRWSDEFETQGFRILLNCWEDYHPEFTGTRKQTEYNEDLVKQSQIFIALFKTKCGEYTKEEVKIGSIYCPSYLQVICECTDGDTSAVTSFLSSVNLQFKSCSNALEMCGLVKDLLLSYIDKTGFRSNSVSIPEEKKIYLTIPQDRESERIPFGNIIRVIDCISEKYFNIRCRLFQKNINNLLECDYYTAILKDHLGNDDEEELNKGIQNTNPKGHPQKTIIYLNFGDGVMTNYPNLKKICDSKGLFTEKYDSRYRIRYNLLKWVLSSLVDKVNEESGFIVLDGWIYYRNSCVISTDELSIEGNNNREKLADFLYKLNLELLIPDDFSNNSNTEIPDIKRIDVYIEGLKSADNLAKRIEDTVVSRLKKLKESITRYVSTLLNGTDVYTHVVDIVKYLVRLLVVEEKLVEMNECSADDLLRTQLLMVQIHDTYPNVFHKTKYNIDNHYLLITKTADTYSFKSPTVEMMRFNYGNYLSRMNRNNEAIGYYATALNNLNSMEDGSNMIRNHIVHLYITISNHLIELGYISEAEKYLNVLNENIEKWCQFNWESTDILIAKIRLISARMHIRPIVHDYSDLLLSAKKLSEELQSGPEMRIPSNLWNEIYCYFYITYATLLIDSNQLKYEKTKLVEAESILKNLERIVLESNILENDERLDNLAKIYHNIGTLYSHLLSQQETARFWCLKGLDCRRSLYKMTQYPQHLALVAETLLMVGATYINTNAKPLNEKTKKEALKYAKESYDISVCLNRENHLEQVTAIIKAKLLIGTILYESDEKDKGIKLIVECAEFDKKYPKNSYHNAIQSEVMRVFVRETGTVETK